MGSFGSMKLVIAWASVFVFLFAVLYFGLGASQGPDGLVVRAFGATIPPDLLSSVSEFADPMQFVRSLLRGAIGFAVPFTFFAAAFVPMADAVEARTAKDFCLRVSMGAVWGLFYSQLLILPIWGFCARIMGSPLPLPLLLADAHALILGLQLLLWGLILNRLIRSNRGIPMLLTLGLGAIGTKLYYFVDFGEAFGMSRGLVKFLEVLNQLLPSSHVAEESIAWGTLVFGVLVTFLLALLPVLVPGSRKASAGQAGASQA
jgi:hypothetical protein